MQIRPAVRTDLPAIIAIESQSFPNPWPRDSIEAYFDDDRAVILVAERLEPIAFLIGLHECTPRGGPVFHIHDFAVAPPHRRQKVGSSLLAKLIALARAQGISKVQLEVRVGNEAACRFYERHGFNVVRRMAHYYEDGGAALRMELDLARAPEPASELGDQGPTPPHLRRANHSLPISTNSDGRNTSGSTISHS